MSTDHEKWENIKERASDFTGSGKPEGLYIPAGDVVNVLNDIEDPRHKALGYALDELTEGYGWGKYPEQEGMQTEELEEFIQDIDGINHPDAPKSVIDELTSPNIEVAYQFPYLEQDEGKISFPSVGGKTHLGDEISVMNRSIESTIIDYLEDRRYGQDFVEESELKEDLKPVSGLGFLLNSPLSMRNSEVADRSKPHDRQNLRDRAIDMALMRLERPDIIAVDRPSDEKAYRSQLNPVQRGLYSKVNPEDGDYEVLMTDRHKARIVPSEF